jgi:hypothetical protein
MAMFALARYWRWFVSCWWWLRVWECAPFGRDSLRLREGLREAREDVWEWACEWEWE